LRDAQDIQRMRALPEVAEVNRFLEQVRQDDRAA
jgi:hypothetical protein